MTCRSVLIALFLLIVGTALSFSQIPEKANQIRSVPMPGEEAVSSNNTVHSSRKTDQREGLLGWYDSVSDKTIHRCPFAISCSRFAEKAVKRHGFIPGLIIFMDRHLIRENPGARNRYARVYRDGRILLDDSYYLTGLKREETD